VNHTRAMSRLWLPASVLESMRAEADRSAPNETGGLLVGYWSGDTAVVVSTIGPGPRAKHRRTWFEPDGEWQNAELARVYEVSGRVHTYVGDWHSHPGARAEMSETDRATMFAIAADADARAPRAITVILGGASPWDVRAWHPDGERVVVMDLRVAA
jgi:integrative and conjugative element protein (TIGR02256 family)